MSNTYRYGAVRPVWGRLAPRTGTGTRKGTGTERERYGGQTGRRADGRADRTQSRVGSRQVAEPQRERPKTDKTQSHRGRRQTGRRATEAEGRQDAE